MLGERIKVIFVDDEEMILSALRRVTRSHREEWDTEFFTSGQLALNWMEQNKCDLIVTDMRMPQMTGTELLRRVRARYPDTIRFMLTGQPDVDELLENVGAIHQFLRKPCDADELRTSILLTSQARKQLTRPVSRQLVSAIENFPAPSDTARNLLKQLGDEASSLQSISQLIESDAGLAIKVLHLANSSFFGGAKRITRVSDAVSRLGIKTIRYLAITSQLFSHMTTSEPRVEQFSTEVWSRGQRMAESCRREAAAMGLPHSSQEAAFLAGLLHEIGRVVFSWHLGNRYLRVVDQAIKENCSLSAREFDEFGSTQGTLGGYLLALWAFDREVVEALTYFEKPSGSLDKVPKALTPLHLAASGNSNVSAIDRIECDNDYLSRIGIALAQPCAALANEVTR